MALEKRSFYGGGPVNAVELRGVSKRFRTAEGTFFEALREITLAIPKGQCLLAAGANGAGKSLLAGIIAGIDEPDSGAVTVRGKTGIIFQEADSQILGETALEDVAFGLRAAGFSPKEAKERARAALRDAGLAEKAGSPARLLSGGEKRRLAVAAMLALNADILIFDEPFANLDYPGIARLNRLLLSLIEDGKTLCVVTHELEKCLALAERCVILEQGRIAFDGAAEEALELELSRFGIHKPARGAAGKKDLLWL